MWESFEIPKPGETLKCENCEAELKVPAAALKWSDENYKLRSFGLERKP